MASSRPKSSQHRVYSFNDDDRMRALNAIGSLSSINPEYQGSGVPLPTSYLNGYVPSTSSNNLVPPPVPPRADTSRYSRYSNYNNFYGPYSRFSPGMFSAYGGCRTPYNRFGMPQDSYNSFIQLAEESTRPAFESIESVVDIVGSISMMLESTYHAVYSSYNAILGVVDQFSRLRDHLAEVLSFLALLRGLKYICLKILYILKLRKKDPSVEAAWNTAASVAGGGDALGIHNKKSPWPFLMFVSLVIGAPWLIFKLLARSVTNKPFDLSSWKERNGKLRACVAHYDFESKRRGELPFRRGEILYLAPNHLQSNVPKGWLLASTKHSQVGLIPQNYLKNLSNTTPRPKNPLNGPSSSSENLQGNASIEDKNDGGSSLTSGLSNSAEASSSGLINSAEVSSSDLINSAEASSSGLFVEASSAKNE